MKSQIKKILKEVKVERLRQIESEGFGKTHDDEHVDDELARAAACYAMPRKYP